MRAEPKLDRNNIYEPGLPTDVHVEEVALEVQMEIYEGLPALLRSLIDNAPIPLNPVEVREKLDENRGHVNGTYQLFVTQLLILFPEWRIT